jgi:hypothetical protein
MNRLNVGFLAACSRRESTLSGLAVEMKHYPFRQTRRRQSDQY